MGSPSVEIKESAPVAETAPAAQQAPAAATADAGLQQRVDSLEQQVANLKEEVRQTISFIQRKYPYG